MLCRRCGRDTWGKKNPKQVMRSECRGPATERFQRLAGADMTGRTVFRFSASSMRLRGYRPPDGGNGGEEDLSTAERRGQGDGGWPGPTADPQPERAAIKGEGFCRDEDPPRCSGQKRGRDSGEEVGNLRNRRPREEEPPTYRTRRLLIEHLKKTAKAGQRTSIGDGPSVGEGRGAAEAGQVHPREAMQERLKRHRIEDKQHPWAVGRRRKGPREGTAGGPGPEAVRQALDWLSRGGASSEGMDRPVTWGGGEETQHPVRYGPDGLRGQQGEAWSTPRPVPGQTQRGA